VPPSDPRSWGGAAAIASGAVWSVALPLAASAASRDPVGWRYDDWNRLLTPAIALLVVALVALRRLGRERLTPWGRRGALIALAGAALLLLGNVVEFWLVLLSDAEVSAIAEPRDLDEWVGSTVGWLTFLVGSLLLLAGGILLGVGSARAGVLPAWSALGLGLTAPLLLASFSAWAVSVVATVPFALALGAAVFALGAGLLVRRDRG
jgi:hypothetical protein